MYYQYILVGFLELFWGAYILVNQNGDILIYLRLYVTTTYFFSESISNAEQTIQKY